MKDVFIKPLTAEFYGQNILPLFLLGLSALLTGYDNYYIRLLCLAVSFIILIYLLIRLWSMKVTSWTITGEQIIYRRGIWNVQKDFLELYRVVDFNEKQNLVQQIAGTKTVVVTSGDKSHPTLTMFGVEKNSNIVEIMRYRVEINKQQKNIYEIANR